MTRLEDLTTGARVQGLLPDRAVTVVQAQWHGDAAITLTFRDEQGRVDQELLYRPDEERLSLIDTGRTWSFDAPGDLFRLASEALRIRLAHLFDPYLAVHTSNLDPLPHQIQAVYGDMLPRMPLRFLLADDPGAGKTIMAGLLIKELMIRGDVRRCLIVPPGSLVEQWQDELALKLGLDFRIITRDAIEASLSGNPFADENLAIARLDQLSRSDEIQAKLEQTDWDLVIVDEAHKMSAHFFGNEVQKTRRYQLGELLGRISRHLLLMTATPHSGKSEDFELFMALIDADRFEGKPRSGTKTIDAQGMMRRMVKEELLTFEGKPLFPERRATTVSYALSPEEAALYEQVTNYVRDEMNRAERLKAEGEGRRGNIVGFALTVLQRRLASSPEAIFQSLRRRRERLEAKVQEERLGRTGASSLDLTTGLDAPDADDLDELPDSELEDLEERVVDQASAAKTIAELEAEIATLRSLEGLAERVRRSGNDAKWTRLAELLQDTQDEMFDRAGSRRKLIIFTEHRDTLNYLTARIRTMIGRPETVVEIHGGLNREARREAQESFRQEPDVSILVATDAAGEGVNLQQAHLLVNYDLPWNPNRIEQRFGRIHRIGQTEVCHMWNLVAAETREGQVFARLLDKLAEQANALGGKVFDVLGSDLFQEESLRDLLIEAVQSFFLEAFRLLGGQISRREPDRYEITHVPADVRQRGRLIGPGVPVVPKYSRVVFDKTLVSPPDLPRAQLLAPGHPLLDAVVDLTLERYRPLLKQGAIFVADADESEEPRALLYVEHAIQNAREISDGQRQVVSKRLQFVEMTEDWEARVAGYAPYLDYRPLDDDESQLVRPFVEAEWLTSGVEEAGNDYAIRHAVPEHLQEVRAQTEARVDLTKEAVHRRLTHEIQHWDHRANELKAQELAGKQPRMNSGRARQRADDLEARLKRRMIELDQERQLSPLPPVVLGGALVIPRGLLERLRGDRTADPSAYAHETQRVARIAVDAVLAAERALGRLPEEQPWNNPGFDILSRPSDGGPLLSIEVKGRVVGAPTFTITKNEVLHALNKRDDYVLALVRVDGDRADETRYVRQPFSGSEEILFGVTSLNVDWPGMFARGAEPS
ncbi:MAG: DUF3883 domain-containing protein [Actinobacteria bacterium]|nr:DUF3883 domain-containing protein [Actinomycetota bacterium]